MATRNLPGTPRAWLAVKGVVSGPVFFRQQRVGRSGRAFSMLQCRSMVAGADGMVDELAPQNDGNGVLFKHKDDARVASVGPNRGRDAACTVLLVCTGNIRRSALASGWPAFTSTR